MESTYGSENEAMLHEIWSRREFCLSAIESVISRCPSIKVICDLGCGDGRLLSKIHESHPDLKLMGIDNSHVAVAAATQRLGKFAEIAEADISSDSSTFPEGTLLVSSGFTANLFPSSCWGDIIVRLFTNSRGVVGSVFDRFFWNRTFNTGVIQNYVSASGEDGVISWESRRFPEFQITVMREQNIYRQTEVKSYNNDLGFLSYSESLESLGLLLRSTRPRKIIASGNFETSYSVDVIVRGGV